MPVLKRAGAPLPVVGSRASRLRATHSYGVVLALIIVAFSLAALLPDDDWADSVLLLANSAIFVTALWTSGVTPIASRTSAGLGALIVLAVLASLIPGGAEATAAVALLTGVMIAASMLVIALGVLDQGAVNAQSVRGAICIYVLLGLLFVFLYGAVAALGDEPFFAQGTDGTRDVRVYFSYVTLATLGYGDYTPGTDVGQLLAILEALVGQLYLVTVVALLVSMMGLHRRVHAEGDEDIPAVSSHEAESPAEVASLSSETK
jgi:Ion channel